jgi:hypothetical protein
MKNGVVEENRIKQLENKVDELKSTLSFCEMPVEMAIKAYKRTIDQIEDKDKIYEFEANLRVLEYLLEKIKMLEDS